MENSEIKDKLIKNGVRNLKAFGYEYVNEQNILSDEVYSAFFIQMLEDNTGHSKQIDTVINELLKQLNQ